MYALKVEPSLGWKFVLSFLSLLPLLLLRQLLLPLPPFALLLLPFLAAQPVPKHTTEDQKIPSKVVSLMFNSSVRLNKGLQCHMTADKAAALAVACFLATFRLFCLYSAASALCCCSVSLSSSFIAACRAAVDTTERVERC